MAQTLEGVFVHGDDQLRRDWNGAALANGEIVRLGAAGIGMAAICTSPEGVASSTLGSVATAGVFRILKDGTTGPTFALGAPVWWDVSANLAVTASGEANVDFLLGECVDKAAGADEDGVYVDLNRYNITLLVADTT